MNTLISRRFGFSISGFSAVALILLGGSAYGGNVHTVNSLSGGLGLRTLRGEIVPP